MVHLWRPPVTTTWKGGRGDIGYIRDKYRVNTSVFEVQFPTTSSAILEGYRAHLHSTRSNQFRGRVGQTRQPKLVALIDAICSKPGIKFPWEEMVRICGEEGAYSVVDAAHCLGQQVDLNLSRTQPDFWITVRLPVHAAARFSRSIGPLELSQMVLREAGMLPALRPQKV